MAQLSQTAWESKYQNATGGQFLDNVAQAIKESSMRTFADDAYDTFAKQGDNYSDADADARIALVVGTLSSLTTVDKTLIVNAINELKTAVDALTAGGSYPGDSYVTTTLVQAITGVLSNLNTTDKTNLVAAINELLTTFKTEAEINVLIEAITGALASLNTTDKTSTVAAINEVRTDAIKTYENKVTGYLTGNDPSLNTSTTFDVSAGKIRVIDLGSDPSLPTVTELTTTAVSGSSVTGIATAGPKFLFRNSSGTLIQQDSWTETDLNTKAYIGYLMRRNSNILYVNNTGLRSGLQTITANSALFVPKIDGAGITGNAAITFQIAQGSMLVPYVSARTSLTAPHAKSLSAINPVTFWYNLQDGSVDNATVTSTVDVGNYDNAGTKTAVSPTTQATIQRLYWDGTYFHLVYGQTLYADIATAKTAITNKTYKPIIPDHLKMARHVGSWALLGSATDLSNTAQGEFFEPEGDVSTGVGSGSFPGFTDFATDYGAEETRLVGIEADVTANNAKVTYPGNSSINTLRDAVTGLLANLNTTTQTNLVAAINELVTDLGNTWKTSGATSITSDANVTVGPLATSAIRIGSDEGSFSSARIELSDVLGDAKIVTWDNDGFSGTENMELYFLQGDITINDNKTTKTGIQYGADYSSDFGDRSLVDKAYVDARVGVLQTASLDLNSTQILSSNTSPIELIAAPGANKIIFVHSYYQELDFGTAVYATNTDMRIKYTDALGKNLSLTLDLSNGADLYRLGEGLGDSGTTASINQPVVIATSSGNPTAGDGTAKYRVTYSIIDLS